MLTLLASDAEVSTSFSIIFGIEDGGGNIFCLCVVCDASAIHARVQN